MADKNVSESDALTANIYITVKVTVGTVQEATTANVTVNTPSKRIVRRVPT